MARVLGVHKSSVSRAIAAGRLTIGSDGRLDEQQALQQWANTRHGGRPDVAERLALARAEAVHRAEPGPGVSSDSKALPEHAEPDTEADPGTLQAYRIQRMTAENARLLLALDLTTFRRYSAERVFAEAHGLGATLRAQGERLVDQIAAQIAARASAEERLMIIEAEVRRLSRAVRASFPAALRRVRQGVEGRSQQ